MLNPGSQSRVYSLIVRWTLLLLVAVLIGCGSRYDRMSCPGSPFPESSVLLALPPFKQLAYFKGSSNDRSPIDFEIWADRKFDFDASLQYHYDKQRSDTQNCPCAMSLMVRHPLSNQREDLGRSFIVFVGSSLNNDVTALQSVYSEFVQKGRLNLASMDLSRNIVGEVSLLQHVTRGGFLQVGFYERDYYDTHLKRPEH